jgi:hypothetical protein
LSIKIDHWTIDATHAKKYHAPINLRRVVEPTIGQLEALTNELKGNLFEYLVGLNLSRLYNIEGEFITSFSGELKDRLLEYERLLRRGNPQLLRDLMMLAQSTAKEIRHLDSDNKTMVNIEIIGKLHGGRSSRADVGEADLLLIRMQERFTPISIKLAKVGSFVNTKSGGVNSFISRYFSHCQDVTKWQESLASELERSFFVMGSKLYELVGLEFTGEFGPEWEEHGLSHLPGQLDRELRLPIFQHYHNVISIIYGAFANFMSTSRQSMEIALLPLLGIGAAAELTQVSCYYKKISKGSDSKSGISLSQVTSYNRSLMVEQLKEVKLMPLKEEVSSFELQLPDYILQIRVKPMNSFTAMGLKVNCSVKRR